MMVSAIADQNIYKQFIKNHKIKGKKVDNIEEPSCLESQTSEEVEDACNDLGMD